MLALGFTWGNRDEMHLHYQLGERTTVMRRFVFVSKMRDGGGLMDWDWAQDTRI